MSREEVRSAMRPHRPTETREKRLPADLFHGQGLKVIYFGPKKTAQAITVSRGGDIWGRIELRPRYLRDNGMNLFGHPPSRILDRLAQDVQCDPFIEGHPGAYCVLDYGLALHFCDSNDSSFGFLILTTDDYFAKYPPEHRVKHYRARKQTGTVS